MSRNRERLLAQFRELVVERLSRISRALMTLEAGADEEAGKQVLRELHGLKGEARMMGFAEINAVVHAMEDLVRAAQGRAFGLQATSVDALLAASDAVSVLSGATTADKPDSAQLVQWLEQCVAAEGGGPPAPSAPRVVVEPPPSAPRASAPPPLFPPPPINPTPVPVLPPPALSIPLPKGSTPPPSIPSPLPSALPKAPASAPPPNASPPTKRSSTPRYERDTTIRISQASLEVLTATATALTQRLRRLEQATKLRRELAQQLLALQRNAEELGPPAQELTMQLARAKELVGELNREHSLLATEQLRDLSVLSEEVQALRMVPLGALFEPYPRMVRELSKELGRELELTIDGQEERADRSVIDALRDPLLHWVRNAIDHGLESPEERVAAGKPPKGRLSIHAIREGERLVIDVHDDGRGLDAATLRRVAVQRGVLEEDHAARLTDEAAFELIFLAGFSSRSTVTDLSGRGVGLDVVRTNLTAVGGEVLVRSTPGWGCTFEMRVPVSLTVAPVLFVQVREERVALAAASVQRAFTLEAHDIAELAGRSGVRFDGSVLPFLTLGSALGLTEEEGPRPGTLVLIVQARGQLVAVGVERVLEERVQSILPLRGMLAKLPYLSGATPLADGAVVLVVSAPHLAAVATGRLGRVVGMGPLPEARPRRRILVVDDSPLTRELLVSLLRGVGYSVLEAVDGAQALVVLQREEVDLVVTDLEMPVMGGLELTRRLKAHASLGTLPVVVVTTRGSDADRRRGMEAGADGYVTKGDLVRQDLVDVVGRLLA